jgi:lysophospholipid acyltransferase (LPLAT)-like uncharacterized protein
LKLQSPIAIGAASLVATTAIRQWMSTLDYAVSYRDPTVDPVHPHYRGAKIFVFWHENILMPLALRGHCNTAMLLSRHTDANILDRVARMMGFGVVRGSTFHGGSTALRELAERAARSNLTITPDGPRGPRRRLAAGCVFLASTLQIPIVAMGFGYQKPWRLRTWDHFAIPRPWSRARAVVSRAISIPGQLDREGVEHHRLGIERILNDLSDEAEAWACSSIRYARGARLSKQASRLAKHAACLPNGPGVSLEAELKAGGVPETGRPAAA